MSGSASPQRPLSFSNNGRASPFRRPDSSPRSPSTVRATTPQPGSPLKTATSAADHAVPSSQSNPTIPTFSPGPTQDRSWLTTRGTTIDNNTSLSPPTSPSRNRNGLKRDVLAVSTAGQQHNSLDASERGSPASAHTVRPNISSRSNTAPVPALPGGHLQASPQIKARTTTSHLPKSSTADPLSTIPHHHLHTMRESFAVLDRNNVGTINSADVLAQLTELGLDTSPAALAEFFPITSAQNGGSMNLSTYLNTLATDLAALSRQDELLNALSAFDDDDSGQIDLGDLCDALAHVVPDAGSGPKLTVAEVERCLHGFTGKRMFKKGAIGNGAGLGGGEKRDVFRYQDFVAGIWGGGEQAVAVKEAA